MEKSVSDLDIKGRGEIFSHLIAVSNRKLCARPFSEQIKRVCALHPRALILREKDLSEEEYEALAKEVMVICRKYDVPCILHFFPKTALKLGCPAIHLTLGQLKEEQTLFSSFKVIGASVHSVSEAVLAQDLGASYITAGNIFETACKPGKSAKGLEFLREVCASVKIPVYGIGGIGIDEGQIRELLSCGAAGGCAMSGMMRV